MADFLRPWGILLDATSRLIVAAVLSASALWTHAAPRSRPLRAEFVRLNPCPSTGKTSGACPGYQVDHREALICGGRDELANLQWLSIEEHKEKTRVEVKLCRPRASAASEGSQQWQRGRSDATQRRESSSP